MYAGEDRPFWNPLAPLYSKHLPSFSVLDALRQHHQTKDILQALQMPRAAPSLPGCASLTNQDMMRQIQSNLLTAALTASTSKSPPMGTESSPCMASQVTLRDSTALLPSTTKSIPLGGLDEGGGHDLDSKTKYTSYAIAKSLSAHFNCILYQLGGFRPRLDEALHIGKFLVCGCTSASPSSVSWKGVVCRLELSAISKTWSDGGRYQSCCVIG